MKRELDYRAWDSKHGIMITETAVEKLLRGDAQRICYMKPKPAMPFKYEDEIEERMARYYELKAIDLFDNPDIALLPYTGVLDEFGKKIYDGDVLATYWGHMRMENKRVEFKDGGFDLPKRECWEGSHNESDTWYDVRYYLIGNIYENPELLK